MHPRRNSWAHSYATESGGIPDDVVVKIPEENPAEVSGNNQSMEGEIRGKILKAITGKSLNDFQEESLEQILKKYMKNSLTVGIFEQIFWKKILK